MDKEKKDSAEEPELTYTVQGDTFAGSWAPPATSYEVTYSGGSAGTVDTMDMNDMMRQDAGKGFENMTFEDYKMPKPFEDSVPTLQKIDELCLEYPSLKIAYDKFRNIWRICYNDYVSKNPDEENF